MKSAENYDFGIGYWNTFESDANIPKNHVKIASIIKERENLVAPCFLGGMEIIFPGGIAIYFPGGIAIYFPGGIAIYFPGGKANS